MIKGIRSCVVALSLVYSSVATANVESSLPLSTWQLPAGKTFFSQEKQIAQLPVPLQSAGYLELINNDLIWHTTTPIDSKLRISSAGVSQWQQQDYIALAGSEFVGQLMLAVLQGQQDFIQLHFSIQPLSLPIASLVRSPTPDVLLQDKHNTCVNLIPLQAPLNQLFSQIILCGQQHLEHMFLIETNASTTKIHLTTASATP
jgi:hypothetical protein